MARRTKDERRVDYLDIGMELVAEATSIQPDPGLALAHVRIADVAARAGVTKGALYHLWDSQEAYWHDLLEYLLEERQLAGVSHVVDLTQELADSMDGVPTVEQWANFMFDHFKDEPTFFARVGIISYLHDDEFRAGIAEESLAGLDGLERLTTDYVQAIGRRARPGVTLRDFSAAVSSLMQGLCLEHRLDPARTADLELGGSSAGGNGNGNGAAGGQRVSLFAAGVVGLLDAFTEPIDGAASGSDVDAERTADRVGLVGGTV